VDQHHKFDPTQPAAKWDTAWRALRDAAGLTGLRFHDLRHTVRRPTTRGRRAGSRRGVDYGTPVAADARALLAYSPGREEAGAGQVGSARASAALRFAVPLCCRKRSGDGHTRLDRSGCDRRGPWSATRSAGAVLTDHRLSKKIGAAHSGEFVIPLAIGSHVDPCHGSSDSSPLVHESTITSPITAPAAKPFNQPPINQPHATGDGIGM
jgi:hypothetical protein